MLEELEMARIVCDGLVRVRPIDEATVRRYADDWDQLPPVLVVRTPDGDYLADGWHRREAARSLGLERLLAQVQGGTFIDAQDLAAKALLTAAHGSTAAERKRALEAARSRHPKESTHAFAKRMGVSQKTIDRLDNISAARETIGPQSIAQANAVSNITQPGATAGAKRRGGRPKQVIKDDHLAAIGSAPKADQVALFNATVEQKLSPAQVKAAARELKDDATPEGRKRSIRDGQVVARSANGDTRGEKSSPEARERALEQALQNPSISPGWLLLLDLRAKLANLRNISDDSVIDGRHAGDLEPFLDGRTGLPADIARLEVLLRAIEGALRPGLRPVPAE